MGRKMQHGQAARSTVGSAINCGIDSRKFLLLHVPALAVLLVAISRCIPALFDVAIRNRNANNPTTVIRPRWTSAAHMYLTRRYHHQLVHSIQQTLPVALNLVFPILSVQSPEPLRHRATVQLACSLDAP
jgi:hypothetical protein